MKAEVIISYHPGVGSKGVKFWSKFECFTNCDYPDNPKGYGVSYGH